MTTTTVTPARPDVNPLRYGSRYGHGRSTAPVRSTEAP